MIKEIQRKKNAPRLIMREVFVNENGAIDLASIMVGIIVIGIIGGIIAATIFAVIPWAQDNAAKAQLDQVRQAENVYAGLYADGQIVASGDSTSALAFTSPFSNIIKNITSVEAESSSNTKAVYGNLTALKNHKLIDATKTNIALGTNNSCYAATIVSDSGNVYWTDSTQPDVQKYNSQSNSTCSDLIELLPKDAQPTDLASFTYNCPTGSTYSAIPANGFQGTVIWSDGTTNTYNTATDLSKIKHTMTPGTTYTVKLQGTFPSLSTWGMGGLSCLRSMDSWGEGTKTTNAANGFSNATNLVSVPVNIPSTVTNTSTMFYNTPNFNDANISSWNVKNITDMTQMFGSATAFNQSLNNWNVSNVKSFTNMFSGATAFNQPLNNWNIQNANSLAGMFSWTSYNQPLNNWDTTKVTAFGSLFYGDKAFNQPLNDWNTANATSLSYMFSGATAFNQPLNNWNTSKVEDMSGTFFGATAFNQPLNNWNTSKVTTLDSTFANAHKFNQNIDNWDVSNVENMNSTFSNQSFNQPVNDWDVSNVTTMNGTFYNNWVFNQPLSKWNTSKVKDMSSMFGQTPAFNQNINDWDVSNVENMNGMFNWSQAFNQPLNKWATGQVTDMTGMFDGNKNFVQDLSGWNVANVTSHENFSYYMDWGDGYIENPMPAQYEPHWVS